MKKEHFGGEKKTTKKMIIKKKEEVGEIEKEEFSIARQNCKLYACRLSQNNTVLFLLNPKELL